MKLNNKGFALTSIIYMLIVLFLLIMLLLLGNLATRKLILDKLKTDVKNKLNQGGINVATETLYDSLLTYYYSDSNPGKVGYKTEPGKQLSETDEGLIMSSDDSGTTYYFRGNVINNYVFFSGKLFRIIRINGDGTIRIILNQSIGQSPYNIDNNEPKYSGYELDRNNQTNSTIKKYLENWYHGTGEFSYLEDPLINYDKYIAYTNYCNDTSTYTPINSINNYVYYSSQNRLAPISGYEQSAYPLFNCFNSLNNYGGIYNLKVGLITADEVAFAGATYSGNELETNHYLNMENDYWTMTPESFTTQSMNWIVSNGKLKEETVTTSASIRPVINLNKNTIILNGNGTLTNPYVVSSEK